MRRPTGTQRFGYLTASSLTYINMDTPFSTAGFLDSDRPEYESDFAQLECRAERAEFTLTQWRHEIHLLRKRCTAARSVSLWRRHGNTPA